MRKLHFICLTVGAILASCAPVMAQVKMEADFALFCEFTNVGTQDESGRYWTANENYKAVFRFASNDILASKIVSFTDPEDLIGPIESRFKTTSETGGTSVTLVSGNPSQRQLHITLGTLNSNAMITEDENDAFKLIATGTCVSASEVQRQIAELESDSTK